MASLTSTTPRPLPIVTAQNLHKSYGDTPALQSLSFHLNPGEFVALLGPNGAGKSTLVQLLSGLFVPDRGEISVLGIDIRAQAHRALAALGVVFQQPSLDLDLSVQNNLLFHTDLHGIPRSAAHQRIADGLEQVGLQSQARAAVRSLSGGNRRKVELIRALLHEPRFLLMDEATVGLDPASRSDILQAVLQQVHARPMAVLWATHLVEEAAQAHRLLVLSRGRLVFEGTPAELMARSTATTLEQAFFAVCPPAADRPPGS